MDRSSQSHAGRKEKSATIPFMSLRVGKTFCKGPRFCYASVKPKMACLACVFGGKHVHTCASKNPPKAAQ